MKKWILLALVAMGIFWFVAPLHSWAITQVSNAKFIVAQVTKGSFTATQDAKHKSMTARDIKTNSIAVQDIKTNSTTTQDIQGNATTTQTIKANSTTTQDTKANSTITSQPQPVAGQVNTMINNGDHSEKINQFLQQEGNKISQNFPYRINLFEQGQTDKNNAGVRIAETAKQLFRNTAGLLFYYQLYNHSMRVPHWHANATEVGSVLNGKMRVTIWQGSGQAKVFTVEKNGTWMIPQAALHSLENAGQGDLTFFVAYNSPNTADRDFATAWAALPNALLEKSLGLNAQEIDTIKKTTVNRLSSFDPSAVAQKNDIASPFSGNFASVRALYSSNNGSIKRIDQTTNPAMQAMALQQTILKPETFRVPHWYTGADDLLFVYKGEAFFTLMDNSGKVFNTMLKAGDLVFIPVGTFHSFVNTGKDNLEIYEAFNAAKNLSEITILNGAQHFSVGTLEGATGLSKDSAQKVINNKREDYILPF